MGILAFAQMLNGRQMGHEITHEEEKKAKELGLVVLFGASDDLAEFRGAIDDEAGCYRGQVIHLDKEGLFEGCQHSCMTDDCKHLAAAIKRTKTIEAVWDAEGYSWIYKTDIPHATFDIFEDGEKYCRGIVFNLAEAFPEQEESNG